MRVLFLFFCVFTTGALSAYPHCMSKDLASPLECIYRLPEGRDLIGQAEKQGPIRLSWKPFSNSYAMWDGGKRAIYLNSSHTWDQGKMIRSILFELHNACAHDQFVRLDQMARARRISKKEYVEFNEKIEHDHALHTVSLLEKGIQSGIFPKSAHWPIERDFAAHFQIQQKTGHSRHLAISFDSLQRAAYS